MNALDKYLADYAEPDALADSGLAGQWQHVLVVPAYREHPDCIDALMPAFRNGDNLLIVVLNRPASDPDTDWALPWRQAYMSRDSAVAKGHYLQRRNPHCQLLLVDHCSDCEPLPADQGVGLARKIGADIALRLIGRGMIASPWIHTTDADVTLPDNYFAAADEVPATASACIYPFRHVGESGANAAPAWPTMLYEWHIRYYAAGLKFAGSPWAFTTVGSTLAVNHSHYAMVRGFPKRAAAEDFYLLNKLAKLGDVVQLQGTPLALSCRHSERVPFGTGRASARIAGLISPAQFTSYHPACFDELAAFNRWLAAFGDGDAGLADCDPIAAWWLEEQPIPANICSQPPGAQKSRQLKEWFDAFRTLKFVHAMRDHQFPDLPLAAILNLNHTAISEALAASGFEALQIANQSAPLGD